MTCYRLVEVQCDRCFDGPPVSCTTARDIRDVVKKEYGWHTTRGPDGEFRDVCAECWGKGLR